MRASTFGLSRSGVSGLALGMVLMVFIIAPSLDVVSSERPAQSDNRALPTNGGPAQADNGAMSAGNKERLTIEDPRPLAAAIRMLETKYGLVITYEDPRYTHPSEIVDVTEKVRRDIDKFEPGKAPRVLVPKGGQLSFEYDEALALTGYQAALVQQLIEANLSIGNAGRFRVEQLGALIHVIPTATKNERGKVVAQASVLDAMISLPKARRSGLKTLDEIRAAVSQLTKTHIILGSAPLNLFLSYRSEEGIARQPARDALAELLGKVGNGTPLSWRLLYDPGLRMYALNIHVVSTAHQ